MAKERDTELWIGIKLGILHGIPVSIKELFKSFAASSNLGLAAYVNWVSFEDGALIKVIKQFGGIPFVKTNVPQLCMIPETVNNIFGWTLNPLNKEWTCGGSSGGEGALVASGCSIVGIGDDVAGSVRIPAAYCGVYGFKSGTKRATKKSTMMNERWCDEAIALPEILPVTSPIANCIDDLAIMYSIINSKEMFEYDYYTPTSPFEYQKYEDLSKRNHKLRIGYFEYDGWFTCTPPVINTIRYAWDQLKS